ncbi:unnamed protein product [marine sediment metagenome]|uniref:Uncharacterized protein n=1 Tax=marine sediment metagenome TaxID=412755 RepID=X1RVL7_9ZZZZ
MPGAIAIAAPRAEEVTTTVSMAAGAGLTGLCEGMVVRIAPQMGAAAPVLTWGALIGVPTLGIFGALFTRGILGDVLAGVAAGGIGVLGYSLPEMISPTVGRRAGSPAQVGGAPVKLLPAGVAGAPARAAAKAAGVRSVIEF